jgi:hypothetical protein
MKNLNDRIFELHEEGLSPGRIAQKLKTKKALVQNVIGGAANGGLGDVVESITKATGIKAVVEAVSKAIDKDCGCKARKEDLNKKFPNRKLNDLSQENFDVLNEWFSIKQHSVSHEWQKKLVGIYNDVFNSKRELSSCSPCIAGMIRELNVVFDEANNN